MARYWQVIAGVLLTVVLGLVISKQSKDISLVLILLACTMVLLVMASYLEPVLDFIRQLQTIGQLDASLTGIMLKTTGIGIITEIAVLICNDSGNGALGKALQVFASAVVLWMALPLMRSLLETVQKIMGEI